MSEDGGYLVPPSWVTQYLADAFGERLTGGIENPSPSEQLLIPRKEAMVIEVPEELLMDCGVIPDTRPALPPPSWRTRLRWKLAELRRAAARRAYQLITGEEFPDVEDW